jgi:hypothetical protein
MPKTVECPNCHQMNAVPMAGIGQYVTCQFCACKYYVYVPPLEETSGGATEPPLVGHAAPAAHQAESARLSPSGAHHLEGSVMFRQESLLATIHEDLVDLRRRITIACFLFVVGCSAVITIILTR